MKKNTLLNNLKEVLESSTMTTYLRSLSSDSERLKLLQKALYFLVATRNYEEVFQYLLKYNDFTFPESYMASKNIVEKQAQNIFKTNYLDNGFLYHGTSKVHSDSIINNGLYGLNRKYDNELKKDLENINSLCQSITLATKKYNGDSANLSSELPACFLFEILDRVYLTPEIAQAFSYSSACNGWFRNFVNKLVLFFNGSCYLDFENKDNLINSLLLVIHNSNAIINIKEKQAIINFIEKYYDELELKDTIYNKVIVFVKNDIELNQSMKKQLESINNKNRKIVYNLAKLDECNLYCQKVMPNDLALLSINDDYSLSLKIGKGGN